MRSKLRSKLSELCVVIIVEISMVSNLLLLYIHQRLVEVFGSSSDLSFAGISIIIVFLSATANLTKDNLCRIQRCMAEPFTFMEAFQNCRVT